MLGCSPRPETVGNEASFFGSHSQKRILDPDGHCSRQREQPNVKVLEGTV